MTTDSVVVMSGGLDSTTLLYHVLDSTADNVEAISFYYGQRHLKELDCARRICADIGVKRTEVNISFLADLFRDSDSSLITPHDVPEGHYAEENMKATVVPNRNMIMASIAAGYAISKNAEALYMGVHAGDHFIYPDCRPRFFNALNAAVVIGNEGFGPIGEQEENTMPQPFIQTPFIDWTKTDIAQLAFDYDVPIEKTWSCYKGGDIHCGKCGTCVERREALQGAAERFSNELGIASEDLTKYEDRDYWKTVVKSNG